MVCPRCNAQIDNDAVFCGNCGNQVAPVAARGETFIEATEMLDTRSKQRGPVVDRDTSRPPLFPAPDARSFASPLPGSERRNGDHMPLAPTVASPTPPISHPRRFDSRRTAFLAIIVVAVLVAASAGVATLLKIGKNPLTTNPQTVTNAAAVSANTKGSISFSDSPNGQGLTDTVQLNISGLGAPSAGAQYNAWLVNEQNEQTLALGKLAAQQGNFLLAFTAPGKNLLGIGNKIIITQETGDANLPSSKPLLTAKFPDLAFVHIKHLLFAFPTTPHNIGLLVGLRDQARQLNAQATLLQGAANSGNTNATVCATQSMLNLIEGKNGPHARVLPFFCTRQNVSGDGFGLLGAGGGEGYIATAAAHASLAATQTDATDTIKLHANHVIIATQNIKGWVTTIDQDAQALLANPGDTGKVAEMVTLADHTLNGVDLDNDEHVDPVPGEAGTITAYIHGQLMAQLTFAP